MLLKEEIEFFVADTGDLTVAPYLHIQPLMRQYGHLYVRRGHPLAKKKHTFEDAWQYGIASVKLPEPMKAGLGLLLRQNSQNLPQLALECDDIHLLHQLAMNTNSVVASTDLAAKPWCDQKKLVKLNTSDFPELYSSIAIVTLAKRALSPVANYTIELFKQTQF